MHIASPLPDVSIPHIALHEFVMEHWGAYGDKTALIDAATGRTVTYAQLGQMVRQVAASLAARGLRPGDIFCLFAPNLPEYAIAYYGILLAGGIVTTVSPLYSAEELARQLKDSGATRLVTVPEYLDKVPASLHEIYVFGEASGALPFAQLLNGFTGLPKLDCDPANDLATLPYSSGTTGIAKGVMLTHRNMIAGCAQVISMDAIAKDDVTIAFLPFFHIYGQQIMLNSGLRQGSTLVIMSRFDFQGFLKAIANYRITRLYLVPPVVLALSKSPLVAEYDLSSVRHIVAGAAPMGHELARVCGQRLGATVRQGYGMTETSCIISVTPAGHTPEQLDVVGIPVPNSEVKLVDGEVWTRGPQIMKGYWNRPEATAEMLMEDGWLRTGDVGEIDENGYLRIVDRVKELIKYKAMQVPPAELEALLVSHPAVLDAAVIGIPDEEAGEIPKAFVVLRSEATAEELGTYIANRVAPYKKIRQWAFVDTIPKSPSGKILRRLLK